MSFTPHIAVVCLPGIGRRPIHFIFSHVFGLERVVMSTTRSSRVNEEEGGEYFFTPDLLAGGIVPGTLYQVGKNYYCLSNEELSKKVKSGTPCFFSVDARGVMALKERLGKNLIVVYVETTIEVMVQKLNEKFKNPLVVSERIAFGEAQLELFQSTAFQERVDLVLDYASQKIEVLAEQIIDFCVAQKEKESTA